MCTVYTENSIVYKVKCVLKITYIINKYRYFYLEMDLASSWSDPSGASYQHTQAKKNGKLLQSCIVLSTAVWHRYYSTDNGAKIIKNNMHTFLKLKF